MRHGCLGVSFLVILLPRKFGLVRCLPQSWWLVLHLQDYIDRSANLLGRQKLSIENVVTNAILLTGPSAKQMAEDHPDQVPMDAMPRATFEVIQS